MVTYAARSHGYSLPNYIPPIGKYDWNKIFRDHEGMSVVDIAHYLHISINTVQRAANRLKIDISSADGWRDTSKRYDWKTIFRVYKNMNANEISRSTGAYPTTVRQAAKRYGIDLKAATPI